MITPNLELRYKIAKLIESALTKIKNWGLPFLVILLLVVPLYA